MASDREPSVSEKSASYDARQGHAHGALPHSHGGLPHSHAPAAASIGGRATNLPTMSLLRLSIRLRLIGAVAFAALIWAATHWATT